MYIHVHVEDIIILVLMFVLPYKGKFSNQGIFKNFKCQRFQNNVFDNKGWIKLVLITQLFQIYIFQNHHDFQKFL